jgi:8-hydroxy-5-deazaflavin:NADPH oxidoreductase
VVGSYDEHCHYEAKEALDMKIGVIGAGHIGGNCARQAVKGGHEVMLSFARDTSKLGGLAAELGERASSGAVSDAVAFGEAVILAVPWGAIPEALEQAGDLGGKVLIDTTNQFGSGPMPEGGETAAAFNAQRTDGARYVKSFNTLTARFQEETAARTGPERVVQWVCGDDSQAKELVGGLIEDMGYVPVDLGGTRTCEVMEAPRRPGAVYGEEYRAADALAVVDAVRNGDPIPPTPQYG